MYSMMRRSASSGFSGSILSTGTISYACWSATCSTTRLGRCSTSLPTRPVSPIPSNSTAARPLYEAACLHLDRVVGRPASGLLVVGRLRNLVVRLHADRARIPFLKWRFTFLKYCTHSYRALIATGRALIKPSTCDVAVSLARTFRTNKAIRPSSQTKILVALFLWCEECLKFEKINIFVHDWPLKVIICARWLYMHSNIKIRQVNRKYFMELAIS